MYNCSQDSSQQIIIARYQTHSIGSNFARCFMMLSLVILTGTVWLTHVQTILPIAYRHLLHAGGRRHSPLFLRPLRSWGKKAVLGRLQTWQICVASCRWFYSLHMPSWFYTKFLILPCSKHNALISAREVSCQKMVAAFLLHTFRR